jgi:hypothetical protein
MRKASVWVAVVVVAIVAGSSLALLNNACKTSVHAWCDPNTGFRHQANRHAESNRLGPI